MKENRNSLPQRIREALLRCREAEKEPDVITRREVFAAYAALSPEVKSLEGSADPQERSIYDGYVRDLVEIQRDLRRMVPPRLSNAIRELNRAIQETDDLENMTSRLSGLAAEAIKPAVSEAREQWAKHLQELSADIDTASWEQLASRDVSI